jgi:hypothetical protein
MARISILGSGAVGTIEEGLLKTISYFKRGSNKKLGVKDLRFLSKDSKLVCWRNLAY